MITRLLTLLFLGFGLFGYSQNAMDSNLQNALQAKLELLLEQEDLNGVSCYMHSNDAGYWYGSAGLENIAQNTPMDTTFSFWAASVTKIFTSAMVFQLIEDSLLSLDDKIVDFITGHPNINPSATIEQALNHTSGIAEILRHPNATQQWYNQNSGKEWDPDEVLSNYLLQPEFSPGSAWGYSNTNYVLLGMIVEALTDTTYTHELQTRIITPLGLDHTWLPPFNVAKNEIASGYSDFNQDGQWDDANFLHTTSFASMVFSAGALVSSPKDLSRMVKALYTGQLFTNPETLDQYLTFLNVRISEHALGYGYGCNMFDYDGDIFYGHGGDINGYTNYAIYSPDLDLSFALMINRDQADRELVTEELLRVFKQNTVGLTAHKNTEISLFPNPASTYVNLKGLPKNAQITLVNNLGQTIKEFGSKTLLDLSAIAPGSYWIHIDSETTTITEKLIIQ